MKNINARSLFAALAAIVTLGQLADTGYAQCSTCATETVAYQPVAYTTYQPVVTEARTAWYPGKLLDKMRLRRWTRRGVLASSAAPTYTAAYASTYYSPAYTTSYVPYTAAYAPVSTVASRPYVTAYAPLVRTTAYQPVVQTAYSPIVASGCSTCAAPTTVYRQVTLQPVTSSCCTSCVADPCGGSCGASQAIYTEPSSGCSSCAAGSSGPIYQDVPSAGPSTGQPTLAPDYPVPGENDYQSNKPELPADGNGANGSGTRESDSKKLEPEAQPEEDTATFFEAPKLYSPNDRTARRSDKNAPTVDVWQAIYHKQVDSAPASYRSGTLRTRSQGTRSRGTRSQGEIISDGWQAVSR